MFVKLHGVKITILFVLITVFQLQHRDLRYDRSQPLGVADLSRQYALQFPQVSANTPDNPVDLAKALYYYVAGPPATGYPGGFIGPENGLFGILNELLGDSQMQNQFFDLNVTSCGAIPETGSMSVPKHALGKLKFNFSPGSRRNPRHFATRPRGRMKKRLDVDKGGAQILSMEMSCDNGDGIISGFILVEGERNIEVYYQFDSLGNRRQVDVYMEYPKSAGNSSDEKFVLRFESIDGDDYQIWTVRTTKNLDDDDANPDSNSVGVAIRGNKKKKKAQVSIVKDTSGNPDDVSDVTAGTQYCLDTATGQATTDCDPVQQPEEGVKGDTFTIGETDALPVETIDYLRSDTFFHEFTPTVSEDVTVHLLTLSNVGVDAISNITPQTLETPFSYVGGTYPGTAGTCGASLAAGATCKMAIQFAPQVTGTFASSVALDYSYLSLTKTLWIDLLGSTTDGIPTAVLASFPSLNLTFSPRAIGSTGKRTFVLTNTGLGDATGIATSALVEPFQFSGGAYPGTAGTCGAILVSESSCSLEIAFTPTSAGGATQPLSVTYDDGQAAQVLSLSLQGEAISPSLLTISESDPYNYGTVAVGGVVDHLFTVTNAGDGAAFGLSAAAFSGPFGFKGGVYPGTGGTCGSSLPGGSSCTIAVHFLPTASGTFMSAVTLNYNDGAETQSVARQLNGTANGAALLLFAGSDPFDFGPVLLGSSTQDAFVVNNNGDTAATAISESGLATPFHFVGGTYPGTGGTCGVTLAPQASCQLMVEFTPINGGAATGSLQLVYNNGISSQVTSNSLLGSGTTLAQLAISDGPSYDFGTVVAGAGLTHTFTITNNGGATASSIAGSGLIAPFAFQGGTYPGTGGTCSSTLAPASTCEIVLAFGPTAAGAVSGTVDINYNNGSVAAAASRDVTGTGTTSAVLTISESDPFDFGVHPVGSSAMHTFTISNSGGAMATSITENGLAAPFGFSGGTYPGTGGTCSASIGAGVSCSIIIEASPVSATTSSDTMVIGYYNGVSAQTASRNIQVTGANPALLSISGVDPYDFGNVTVGASSSHTFTVTNSGGVSAMSLTGSGLVTPYQFTGGSYPGSSGTCGSVLAAGSNCTIEVSVTPPAAGTQSGTLNLDYIDGVNPQTIARSLTANGVVLAALEISSGPTFAFGAVVVGSNIDHVFTVTNNGGGTATSLAGNGLAAPYNFSGGAYPGVGGTCGATLAAASNCSVAVGYSPVSISGADNDTLVIDYNDGGGANSATRPLTGSAVSGAMLAISESDPYSFGSVVVGGSASHTFVVTNTGGAVAGSISEVGLGAPFGFSGGTYPGTGGSCGASLSVGASCNLVVQVSPTVSGVANDTLDLSYNNGVSAQNVARAVTVTGINTASLSISETDPFSFGNVTVGGESTHLFTITNMGSGAATSLSEVGLGAPFGFTGGVYPGTAGDCGATLSGSATCQVSIAFAPGSSGLATDTFSLQYNDGVGTQSTNRNVQGTGVTAAALLISESDPYDFGTLAVGGEGTHLFTVTNAGGSAATLIAEIGLGAPFQFTGGSYPGTGGTCAATLSPSSTCDISIVFAPTASGVANDSIQLSYNDGVAAASTSRDVQGVGVTPASLTISESPSYDFGSVATGITQTHLFTVTNVGGSTAASLAGGGLEAPFDFNGGVYPGSSGTCGLTLASASTCTLDVSYSPTAIGLLSDTMELNYSDGVASQQATRTIQGTGM